MYSGTIIVKRSAREENGIIQMIKRRNGNKEEREKTGKEREVLQKYGGKITLRMFKKL